MTVDCPLCGGPVSVDVTAGLVAAHGQWVMRPGGMRESTQRCPASMTAAPLDDVHPTEAVMVLLAQVDAGRLYMSRGTPRFANGQRFDARVWADASEFGLVAVDGKRPVVTEDGRWWMARLS